MGHLQKKQTLMQETREQIDRPPVESAWKLHRPLPLNAAQAARVLHLMTKSIAGASRLESNSGASNWRCW